MTGDKVKYYLYQTPDGESRMEVLIKLECSGKAILTKFLSDTTEIVSSINRKIFWAVIKSLFQALERMFHCLECMFHCLKYTFQTLEQKLYHREKTFIALSYNNLSTMFQKCGKYAGKQSL